MKNPVLTQHMLLKMIKEEAFKSIERRTSSKPARHRLSEADLRQIINEEIRKELFLYEAVDADSIVDMISKKKISDANILKDELEKLGDDEGVKSAFENDLDKIRQAFVSVKGKDSAIDALATQLKTGKSAMQGSISTAISKAAEVLGIPPGELAGAAAAVKSGKEFDSLPTSKKLALAKLGFEMVKGNPAATKAAGIALSKVGEKQIK